MSKISDTWPKKKKGKDKAKSVRAGANADRDLKRAAGFLHSSAAIGGGSWDRVVPGGSSIPLPVGFPWLREVFDGENLGH